MNISRRWWKTAELYKIFAPCNKDEFDWSNNAALELYEFETYGRGQISPDNGFAIGKKFMDITSAMWNEDILKQYLFDFELYEDPNLPNWWLDKILEGH